MGCSGLKSKSSSRYIWMEFSGETGEKKRNKFETRIEVKLGSKKGDLFHAKLGGLTATAVMLSYLGTRY